MEVRVLAPAKVNWHLEVGEKRKDGFHEISSVFQKVSLCDELYINYSEAESFSCEVLGLEELCKPGESTLDKAALLWSVSTGIKAEVSVRVVKNIPSQSGLGGGSSDAASFLLALEKLSGYPSSPLSLLKLAASVGSDVPFFAAGCDAALVFGRGETVCPIEARHDLTGYLLMPQDEKVSTAQAYAALDGRSSFDGFLHESDILNIYKGPVGTWKFTNSFELVNNRPCLALDESSRLLLSGSGSCWVLVSDKPIPRSVVADFKGSVYEFSCFNSI